MTPSPALVDLTIAPLDSAARLILRDRELWKPPEAGLAIFARRMSLKASAA